MKVNKVKTNVYNPLTQVSKKSKKTSKNSNDRASFMSDLSFKGYTKVKNYGYIGTSGTRVTIDKGWHSDLKKVTNLYTGEDITDRNSFNYGYAPYNVIIKTYYSDWNETPDIEKLREDKVDYLVEYVKPEAIKLSDINQAFLKAEPQSIDLHKVIDYTWAEKDQLQREYDGLRSQIDNTDPELDIEELALELKLKELKLYKLGSKIDAYGKIQELVNSTQEFFLKDRKNT